MVDQNLTDDAIVDPESDLLGRVHFASMLNDLIEKSPPTTSLRIAVYGAWGEGKTWVLRLLDLYASKRGDKPVWIYPWMYAAAPEVIAAILKSVANAIGLRWRDRAAYWIAASLPRFLRRTNQIAEFDPRLKAASKVLSTTLAPLSKRGWKAATDRHLRLIFERLGDNRIIVFIDDIDRTRPGLVPDLLMNLREALNLPKISFVMALSPEVIGRGMKSEHEGWGDSAAFLEKIIEWPFFLPPLSDDQFRASIRKLASLPESRVDANSLIDIAPYLPRNPRRLKAFLRLVGAMHGLLSRFEDDEINLSVFYLCVLARIEFPHEASALLSAADFSKLALRRSMQDVLRKNNDGREETSEGRDLPNRLGGLEEALIERAHGISEYQIHETFNFIDQPPILTWKEARSLFDSCAPCDEESAASLIEEWIGRKEEAARAEALFSWLIRLRWRLWNIAIDRTDESETQRYLGEVTDTTRLLLVMIHRLKVVQRGWIGADTIGTLFSQAEKYSGWTKPDYYIATRREEISLMLAATSEIPERVGLELMGVLMGADERFRTVGEESPLPEYVQAVENVRKQLSERACEVVLRRFRESPGIEVFWGDDPRYRAEKSVAFDPNSSFHRKPYREALTDLAGEASDNQIIASNFLNYFRMLAAGAIRGGSFDPSQCTELLRDSAFAEIIWTAATTPRLNPRMVGSLRGLEEELIKSELRSERFPRTLALRNVEYEFGFEGREPAGAST